MTKRIGDLSIRLNLDGSQMNKSTKEINQNLGVLKSEMAILKSKGKEWGNSVEGLSQKHKLLSDQLTLEEAKVRKASEKHKELVRVHGQASPEVLKHAASMNKIISQYTKTEAELNRVSSQMSKHKSEMSSTGRSYDQLAKKADKLGDSLKKTGSDLKDTGQNLTTGVTLPLVGLGTAAGKAALDFQKSAGNIQAELGVSAERAEELNNIAKGLWKDGFGESLADVSFKISGVTKSLGELGNVDLSYVTKGLDLIESKGWGDQKETLRALKSLMESYGLSASEAMDYITKGFQENLDFSGEFLDSISEFSTYYAEVGLSADDMFAKFKSGAESGVFKMDKIGDSMKEFTLRAKDGSKTSAEAFEVLGLNASKMTDAFNKGGSTAKDAFHKVVKALQETDDETARNIASTGLFGAQYEDVGKKSFDAMLKASDGLENVEGATKRASYAMKDNFGDRATRIWRDFQEDLLPVGETLLDIAEDVLPKLANTLGDVTEGFGDMSPNAQKVALSVAGIAAAAGPTIAGIGILSQGLGTVAKVTSPVLKVLGKGAGLTGILGKIPGPIGLIVTGLGLATGAFLAIKDATNEAKEVNLDHLDSLVKQKSELGELSSKYNELRDKNKLSNEELLRFRDIQAELKLARSKEEIKNLSDEAERLSKKSGLSNDEMSNMLKLNDEIIKLTPEVQKSFSDRGKAIIDSKGAIDEVNNSLSDSIRLELENQRIKNEANLDKNIRKQIEAVKELKGLEKERNQERKAADEIEATIADLKIKKQRELNEGKEGAVVATQVEIERQEGLLVNTNNILSKMTDKVSKQQEAVTQTEKEINKTIKLYDEMINVELAQANINEKGGKGIAQLDEAIKKNQDRIQTLTKISESQGGLNAKQQEELKTRSKTLTEQQKSRDAIRGLKSDQESVNSKIDEGTGKARKLTGELGKKVTKNVKVDDNGGASALHAKATKKGTKGVNVTDYGKTSNIHEAAGKTAYKGIRLNLLNSLSSIIPSTYNVGISVGARARAYAKGTDNAPAGVAIVGEAGRELMYDKTSGFRMISEPTLMNLEQGAKIMPNRDTEALLSKWGMPSGSNEMILTQGMMKASGRDQSPVNNGNRPTVTRNTNSGGQSANQAPQPININVDGQTLLNFLLPRLENHQKNELFGKMLMRGFAK